MEYLFVDDFRLLLSKALYLDLFIFLLFIFCSLWQCMVVCLDMTFWTLFLDIFQMFANASIRLCKVSWVEVLRMGSICTDCAMVCVGGACSSDCFAEAMVCI